MLETQRTAEQYTARAASNSESSALVPIYTVIEDKVCVREKILNHYDAFIFDMDGVIWRLDEPIVGAREALDHLARSGKDIFFVTNNSLCRATDYAEKLKSLNLGTFSPDRIFCSSNAAALYLKRCNFHGQVYMIGPPALREELEQVPGIEVMDSAQHNGKFATPHDMMNEPTLPVASAHCITYQSTSIQKNPLSSFFYLPISQINLNIQAVVMGFDAHINYYKIAYAAAILNHNPNTLLVFTNADHQFPTPKYILPGTGSFVSALQLSSARKGIVTGKPGLFIIDEILRRFPHLRRERVCMVGDNLMTDIEFGNVGQLGTILVESGVHKRSHVESTTVAARIPRFIIPSIAYLNPDADASTNAL